MVPNMSEMRSSPIRLGLLAAPWILALLLILARYFIHGPRLRDYEPLTSGPLVSIIIPARNEARKHRALRAVRTRHHVRADRSDRRGRPLDRRHGRDHRALRSATACGWCAAPELPAGWFGKQWAIVQGYRVARGELLVFADADTRHEPELVPRAVRGLQTRARRSVHRAAAPGDAAPSGNG